MDEQAIQKAERIDRFLQGKMTQEEQKAFEYQLAQDTGLQEELEKTDMTRQAVRQLGLRMEVKDIRERMLQEEHAKTLYVNRAQPIQEIALDEPLHANRKLYSFYQYSYRIAAGIALVLVSFVVVQMVTIDPESLYASKMELNVNSDVTRGREETSNQAAIRDAYQQNNFEAAVSIYTNLDSPSSLERYFAAAAYLQLAQYDNAISTYQQILANEQEGGNEFLRQESSYKLALTYIRQREYDKALPILEKLDNNYEYYDNLISSPFLWKLKLLRFKDGLLG